MLYKDIDMMLSDSRWFDKFCNTKELYDKRGQNMEALKAYKDARKELKKDFDMIKMMG